MSSLVRVEELRVRVPSLLTEMPSWARLETEPEAAPEVRALESWRCVWRRSWWR